MKTARSLRRRWYPDNAVQCLGCLLLNEDIKDLRLKEVRVFDYPDGTLSIKYDSVALPYTVFDKDRQVKQVGIVSNKRLSSVLQFVQEQ